MLVFEHLLLPSCKESGTSVSDETIKQVDLSIHQGFGFRVWGLA